MRYSTWQIWLILLVAALGVVFTLPNFFSQSFLGKLPDWLPKRQITLGLDLQGGSHLLLEVDTNALVKDKLDALVGDIRLKLRQARIGYRGLGVQGEQVVLTLTEPGQADEALRQLRDLNPVVAATGFGATSAREFAIDASPNGRITVALTDSARDDLVRAAVTQSLEVVRRRIDELGTREPTIQRQGASRILVQVPGEKDPESIKRLLGKTARLTFHMVDLNGNVQAALAGNVPAGDELLPSADDTVQGPRYYLVDKRVDLSGENLTDAQPTFQNNEPVVSFRLDSEGARKFGHITQANVGKPFAIVLDDKVISAPNIREPILGGSGVISGSFTVQSANDLAILLRAGALPAPLTIVEERTVGPDLGADSIRAGAIASVLAVALVIGFMLLYYGLFGFFADVALFVNLFLILASLSLLGATLTLPGIAGIVLTIGMAVDFERADLRAHPRGDPQRQIGHRLDRFRVPRGAAHGHRRERDDAHRRCGDVPVRHGPDQGLRRDPDDRDHHDAVHRRDLHAPSHLVLVQDLASQGRAALRSLLMRRLPRLVPDNTKIPFMRFRQPALIGSAIVILGSILLVAFKGLNYGIDFQGGILIEASVPQQRADLGSMRATLGKLDLGDVQLQTFGAPNDVLIRVQSQGDDPRAASAAIAKVKDALDQLLGKGIDYRRAEFVGPKVSSELLRDGVLATVLAVVGVLIYLWFRFEWQYGVGAVIALLHDTTATIGIFALLGMTFDLSTVAAVLTIIGYSLNDTVVVFDRIRENLRRYRRMPLEELLDRSINETLARTIMTSMTTFLALLALFIFGGEVIRGFTFAMIWGVFVGTYSTIFIAAARPHPLPPAGRAEQGSGEPARELSPGGGDRAGRPGGSSDRPVLLAGRLHRERRPASRRPDGAAEPGRAARRPGSRRPLGGSPGPAPPARGRGHGRAADHRHGRRLQAVPADAAGVPARLGPGRRGHGHARRLPHLQRAGRRRPPRRRGAHPDRLIDRSRPPPSRVLPPDSENAGDAPRQAGHELRRRLRPLEVGFVGRAHDSRAVALEVGGVAGGLGSRAGGALLQVGGVALRHDHAIGDALGDLHVGDDAVGHVLHVCAGQVLDRGTGERAAHAQKDIVAAARGPDTVAESTASRSTDERAAEAALVGLLRRRLGVLARLEHVRLQDVVGLARIVDDPIALGLDVLADGAPDIEVRLVGGVPDLDIDRSLARRDRVEEDRLRHLGLDIEVALGHGRVSRSAAPQGQSRAQRRGHTTDVNAQHSGTSSS